MSGPPALSLLPESAAPAASWRLFVAAPVPEMAAARVWEALADVRTLHPAVKWLPMNKLHLTLLFLGQTDPARVPDLSEAVKRVALKHEPFDVATGDGGGRIHDRRGGVAWLTAR